MKIFGLANFQIFFKKTCTNNPTGEIQCWYLLTTLLFVSKVLILTLESFRNIGHIYNYIKLILWLMFASMHWTVDQLLNSIGSIQKLTSFRGTWLFTTICSIWKMVSTIVIATLENSLTVTVILTVSLVNSTFVLVRATGLGACMVFMAGIG